ncbi:hypothetical protein [Longimycelium tulufanense]|nr:hypothetical protein [Longimycelium tulufanense]
MSDMVTALVLIGLFVVLALTLRAVGRWACRTTRSRSTTTP